MRQCLCLSFEILVLIQIFYLRWVVVTFYLIIEYIASKFIWIISTNDNKPFITEYHNTKIRNKHNNIDTHIQYRVIYFNSRAAPLSNSIKRIINWCSKLCDATSNPVEPSYSNEFIILCCSLSFFIFYHVLYWHLYWPFYFHYIKRKVY